MRVILLDKIQKLGNVGDTAEVRPGYARNYLFPQSKALPDTAENQAQVETHRAEWLQRDAANRQAAEALKQQLKALEESTITVEGKANEERRLYGSIGSAEVVVALAEVGATVQESQIELPDGPIRELGEFQIRIRIDSEDTVALTLAVLPA